MGVFVEDFLRQGSGGLGEVLDGGAQGQELSGLVEEWERIGLPHRLLHGRIRVSHPADGVVGQGQVVEQGGLIGGLIGGLFQQTQGPGIIAAAKDQFAQQGGGAAIQGGQGVGGFGQFQGFAEVLVFQAVGAEAGQFHHGLPILGID